jgi:hypothetical protein
MDEEEKKKLRLEGREEGEKIGIEKGEKQTLLKIVK